MKNEKLTIGIVGFGRFGKLWAKYMAKHGQVFVFDKKNKVPSAIAADLKKVASADIVFLAVPISELENSCKAISPFLLASTLVVDVSSVKTWPVQVMKKFLPKDQSILATHPLFGPDSERAHGGIKGFKIVVCPLKRKNLFEKKLMEIFKKMGLQIIVSTPEEHDWQMANSQALVHFIGRGLAKLKLGPQKMYTPDYMSLMRLNEMVTNDTWQLFFDMQTKNPFADPVRRKFMENLKVLDKAVAQRKNTLEDLRKNIEQIDDEIIKLLSARAKEAKNIGLLKQKGGLKVLDLDREKKLIQLRRRSSGRYNIDPRLTQKIFEMITEHSRAIQKKI